MSKRVDWELRYEVWSQIDEFLCSEWTDNPKEFMEGVEVQKMVNKKMVECLNKIDEK